MTITASARHDRKTMEKYLRFNMFKGRFYKISPYIYGVLVAIFIFVAIMYQIALGFQLFMTAAAVILTVAYAVQIIYFYAYPVMKMKKREYDTDNEIIYSFTDDGFDFYTAKAGEDKKAHFPYSKLFKIYETKEFFYMYLNKTGAFIVDKATVDGDVSELSSAIKTAAGKGKYIKCL